MGVYVAYALRSVYVAYAPALVLLFSLVASGQIRLRKIDGWQKIAGVVSRHVSPAAA